MCNQRRLELTSNSSKSPSAPSDWISGQDDVRECTLYRVVVSVIRHAAREAGSRGRRAGVRQSAQEDGVSGGVYDACGPRMEVRVLKEHS